MSNVPRASGLVALLAATLLAGAAPAQADPATAERLQAGIAGWLDLQLAQMPPDMAMRLDGAVTVAERAGMPGRYVVTVPGLVWPVVEELELAVAPVAAELREAGPDLFDATWTMPHLVASGTSGKGEPWNVTLRYGSQQASGRFDAALELFRTFEVALGDVTLATGEGEVVGALAEARLAGERVPDGSGLVDGRDTGAFAGFRLGPPETGEGVVTVGGLEMEARYKGYRPAFEREWLEVMARLAQGGPSLPAEQQAALHEEALRVLARGLVEGGGLGYVVRDVDVRTPGKPAQHLDLLRIDISGGAGEEPEGAALELELAGLRHAGREIGSAGLAVALTGFPTTFLEERWSELATIDGLSEEEAQARVAALGQELLRQAVASGAAFELRDLRLERPGARLMGEGRVEGATGAAMGALMKASLSLEGIEALEQELGGSETTKGIFVTLRAFGQPAEGGRLDYLFALDEAGQLTVNGRDLLPIISLLMQGDGQPQQGREGPQRRASRG